MILNCSCSCECSYYDCGYCSHRDAHCNCCGVKFLCVCNLRLTLLWSDVAGIQSDAVGMRLRYGYIAVVCCDLESHCNCGCSGARNRSITAASCDAICNLKPWPGLQECDSRGESQQATLGLHDLDEDLSLNGSILQNIFLYASWFDRFTCTHVLRYGNKPVECLAKAVEGPTVVFGEKPPQTF